MKFEHIFLELKNKINQIDGFELNSHNLIKVLNLHQSNKRRNEF